MVGNLKTQLLLSSIAALALLLRKNGHRVTLWSYSQKDIDYIRSHAERSESIYVLFVTDKERHLEGVVTVKDLLLHDYEDYIGFIFRNVDDVRELIKYKNLAEMLENATDAHKKISDRVRDLLLNYLSD